MGNESNIYSAGQFYPGFGKDTGIDLANECKSGTKLLSANVETGLIQRISVALTSAQLLAMNATPVVLIPAPGAGLTIILDNILFTMNRTATAYANGGTVVLRYTTGAVAAINTIAATVLTTAGAGTTKTVRHGIDAAAVANDGIEISNASAPFITGTGDAVVDIVYRII